MVEGITINTGQIGTTFGVNPILSPHHYCDETPMTDCLFCNLDSTRSDILWETDNFFVKVGVGILTPGHIMIIPRRHFSCFGELPKELEREFLALKNGVFNRLRSAFREPIVWEQGIYGQSINHAHLHFVPKKSDNPSFDNLYKRIFRELESIELDNILAIRDIYGEYGQYIYFEEDGRKWAYITEGLPDREFNFRKEFVRLTGIDGLLDWRTMSEAFRKENEEWVRVTKEKLKASCYSEVLT